MDEFMESFVKFKSPISRIADLKITYELSSPIVYCNITRFMMVEIVKPQFSKGQSWHKKYTSSAIFHIVQ